MAANPATSVTNPFTGAFSEMLEPQVRARGRSYFQKGLVLLRLFTPGIVQATVRGTSDYAVGVKFTKTRTMLKIDTACSCPYRREWGTQCKHVWATLLAIENDRQNRLSLLHPLPARMLLDGESPADYEPENAGPSLQELEAVIASVAADRGLAADRFMRFIPAPPKPKPKPAPWLTALGRYPAEPVSKEVFDSAVNSCIEPLYVIDGQRSSRASSVYLDVQTRKTRRNGQPGQAKKLLLTPQMVAQLSSELDRKIGLFLLGARPAEVAYYYPYEQSRGVSQWSIPPSFQSELFPLLNETGQFFLRIDDFSEPQPVRWDGGTSWSPLLRILPSVKNFSIVPQMKRGESYRNFDEFKLLVNSERPVAAVDGVIAPVDASRGSVAWFRELAADQNRLAIKEADAPLLLDRLRTLSSFPQIEWPPQWGVLTVNDCLPLPRMDLQLGDEDSEKAREAVAEISFLYDGLSAPSDGSVHIADAARRRVICRNREAERRALVKLGELGARPDPYSNRWILPSRRLETIISSSLAEGWQVYGEDKLYRKSGAIDMSVTSGIDWFDLTGTIQFDGDQVAKLGEVLAAFRKGDRFVRLGDGSLGLLPTDWLAKNDIWLELGQTENGAVRFSKTQIGLVDALLAAMPEARFDESVAAARQKLRRFDGIKPLSEPDGFIGKLRPYQQEGLGWMSFLDEFGWGGCLADDMGLGKTVQVLALLTARKAQARSAPSLVVAPKSLVFNWEREARRFAPALKVLAYAGAGSARKPLRDQVPAADLVITTYDLMRQEIEYFSGVTFDYVLLDEAQAIKNAQSQRAKAARCLQAKQRLALSGTPIENRLQDLWSILDFLNPGMLGSVGAFSGLAGKGNGNPTHLDILQRAVRPFVLRRTKTQVAPELPQRVEQTVFCDLGPAQEKYYTELRDAFRISLLKRVDSQGLAKSKIHVLEALLRLRQAACHPGLIDAKKEELGSAKLETVMEMLESIIEEGHKALVYSQFTSMLAFVRAALDQRGITYEYLDGQTQDRSQRVDRFQNDAKCPLFLLSLKAGGVGLNLTAAEYVFLLDPWWNPASEAQAIDRTHRIGQNKNVIAYRLIAHGTIEEKILELQQSKRRLADSVITDENSLIAGLTREDLATLLS